MLMVTAGGVVLLGLLLLVGRLRGGTAPALGLAARLFIPVWPAVLIANLWIGVGKAGYTVARERPILLTVFAVPAVLAVLAIWHFARS